MTGGLAAIGGLPDRGPALTRHLDDTVLQPPAVALEAARRALREIAAETLELAVGGLEGASEVETAALRVRQALQQVQDFLAKVPAPSETDAAPQLRVAQMHAVDHLNRLLSPLTPPETVRRVLHHPHLESASTLVLETLKLSIAGLRGEAPDGWVRQVGQQAAAVAELRRAERPRILQETAEGAFAPSLALDLLDAMRWLDRLGYHAWRLSHYLGAENSPEPPVVEETEFAEAETEAANVV